MYCSRYTANVGSSTAVETPDVRHGQFERVSVGIAKIDRGRAVSECDLLLDCHAVLTQMFAPGGELVRADAECHVTRAGRPVRWQRAFAAGDFRAEKQQHARAIAHLQRGASSSFEVAIRNQAKAQNVHIKTD